ncbi:creatininase family protein [Roseospirillum parvum]|uniref:Creatinine amidohydrolase n=1 Tax=Roseospirillum parvum TaxID=83401 RepID=A0A1G7WGC1_9PROT|nr:creatininase family protein [Roseospirillum parvum]SDG70240.1 creatinine amidohydrolase [Roseospirillum parvum]
MQLATATWPEVEAYLATCTGIVVPIGSTEQHGPNGLIGTDALCAEAVARGVGEATGALVAPTLSIGMAEHHMAFPGTITLKPSTLVALIGDVVGALAEHGFDRFLFVNGHGGNIPSLNAAFYEVHAARRATRPEAPGLRMRIANWFLGPAVGRLAAELYGDNEGSHATPSEVSLTQHLLPEHIKPATFSGPAPRGSFHDRHDVRRRFPDGRMGSDPSLSRPEHGARLLDTAVGEIAEAWHRLLAED